MQNRTLLTLLLLAMLCMQSAVALHDIEHQEYSHSELCQAYVTGDHSFAIEIAAQSPLLNTAPYLYRNTAGVSYYSSIANGYSSRAPPAHI